MARISSGVISGSFPAIGDPFGVSEAIHHNGRYENEMQVVGVAVGSAFSQV